MKTIENTISLNVIAEAIQELSKLAYREFDGFTLNAITPSYLTHYKTVKFDFEIRADVSIVVEGELTIHEREGSEEYASFYISEVHFFNDTEEFEYSILDITIKKIRKKLEKFYL